MPIYEYRCNGCGKKVSILTLRVSEKVEEVCEHCGGRKLTRLMSRFAMPRSEDSRLDALSDPSSLGDVDENDPQSMARFMRRMGREMGDEFAGNDFDEMIDDLESGKSEGEDGETPDGGDSSED